MSVQSEYRNSKMDNDSDNENSSELRNISQSQKNYLNNLSKYTRTDQSLDGKENVDENSEDQQTKDNKSSDAPSTYSEKFRHEPASIVGSPTDFPIENDFENVKSKKKDRTSSPKKKSKRSEAKSTMRQGLKTGAKILGTTLKQGATALIISSLNANPNPKGLKEQEESEYKKEYSGDSNARAMRTHRGKDHNALVEHLIAKLAHKSHKYGSMAGHYIAKSLRNVEIYIEVEEEKRIDLERRVAFLGVDPQTGEKKDDEEMTSIEDINFALHELTDLITAKLLVLRDSLIEKENQLDERETQAILTGDDIVKRSSKFLKKKTIQIAMQTSKSVKAALKEKDCNQPIHSKPKGKEFMIQ